MKDDVHSEIPAVFYKVTTSFGASLALSTPGGHDKVGDEGSLMRPQEILPLTDKVDLHLELSGALSELASLSDRCREDAVILRCELSESWFRHARSGNCNPCRSVLYDFAEARGKTRVRTNRSLFNHSIYEHPSNARIIRICKDLVAVDE